MSFADLEARANVAVMARLTNAQATLGNGAAIDVIFDRAYIASMSGQIDSTEPMCLLKSADVTAQTIAFGTLITIGAVAYQVRGLHPDGTGLTSLMLELA